MQPQRTIIHFVRHGEVENPRAVRYGRLPGFHLSEAGRKQVEQTTLFFVRRKIDRIYTSPLERTQQTATLLSFAFPHIDITLDDRLIEVKTPAKFEGRSREMAFYYPTFPRSDFEMAEQIIGRFRNFIEEKVIQHHGREVIAVTHGDPIAFIHNALLCNVPNVDRGRYPAYASVYSFVFSGLDLCAVWYEDHTNAGSKREVGSKPTEGTRNNPKSTP